MMRHAALVLVVGSVAVACGSTEVTPTPDSGDPTSTSAGGSPTSTTTASTTSTTATSTSTGAGGGQMGAGGGSPSTEVAIATCDTPVSGTTFAVASFPNRSADELAGARFIGTPSGTWPFAVPAGFATTTQHFGAYVKEGSIAVGCGPSTGPYLTEVRIVVPID
jgi:hypothetical protein